MKTTSSSLNFTIDNLPQESLIHSLEDSKKIVSKKSLIWAVSIIVLGTISGYLLSNATRSSNANGLLPQSGGTTQSKMTVGSSDAKVFRDSAEGELETGGINGEGTHKLIRPGGVSQTVYLTSSMLDLNQFVGKKVRVWGETFSAQKAGWLMDVGKVEVL